MKEIDEQIRNALQAEQNEFKDEEDLDYEGVMKMFQGHTRWITTIWFSLMAVTVTVMVISAIQFFRVESTRAMIAWATGFTVCFVLEALIEFCFLAECRKNTIQCHIRRLELQITALASDIRKETDQQEK